MTPVSDARLMSVPSRDPNSTETAILAAGCFWGVQSILRELPGVVSTTVGYCGGVLEKPKYTHVKTGESGHAEAIEVIFDPAVLTYERLLDLFFRLHDPTQLNRQMNDIGTQYRSAIFYLSDEQKRVAEEKRAAVNASGKWGKPIATQIVAAFTFWKAEDEHQDYLKKYPDGYNCHWVRD